MLRHTYATRYIESGMQSKVLQKKLGHLDITITLNTYTDIFSKYEDTCDNSYINYLEKKEISAKELINIARELNELFSLLQSDVIKYVYENTKNSYRVCERLERFSFKKFNTIYESDVLREVGMIMTDF